MNNYNPTNPTTPQRSQNTSTILRIHGKDTVDHRGYILVEAFHTQSNGATTVQQHWVNPNTIQSFVRQYAQHHPNVHIQNMTMPSAAPPLQAGVPTPQNGFPTSTLPNQTPTPTPDGFSTSSLGGLDGYDKYGSSYGAFTNMGTPVQQSSGAPPSARHGHPGHDMQRRMDDTTRNANC